MRAIARAVTCLVAALLFLVGCAPADRQPGLDDSARPSSETSIGVDVPQQDSSLSSLDSRGKRPEDVVLDLIDATNSSDWENAYSLYANPEVDFMTAAREWDEADESYRDFTVHETRVIDSTRALVRVTYRAQTKPPAGAPYDVVIEEPGEWWGVDTVGGVWKVQWLPRQ